MIKNAVHYQKQLCRENQRKIIHYTQSLFRCRKWIDSALPSLSYKQRMIGFMTCLVLGLICFAWSTIYIPMLVFKARKFALLFSLGSGKEQQRQTQQIAKKGKKDSSPQPIDGGIPKIMIILTHFSIRDGCLWNDVGPLGHMCAPVFQREADLYSHLFWFAGWHAVLRHGHAEHNPYHHRSLISGQIRYSYHAPIALKL